MPRTSAAVLGLAGNVLSGPPLEPSDDLSPEQVGYWQQLVRAFPGGWFGEDHRPLLTELVRHQAIARKLDEQLTLMRQARLTLASPESAKLRTIFLQLAKAARAETETIVHLCTKLRVTPHAQQRPRDAGIERRATPVGPRPWDSAGQH